MISLLALNWNNDIEQGVRKGKVCAAFVFDLTLAGSALVVIGLHVTRPRPSLRLWDVPHRTQGCGGAPDTELKSRCATQNSGAAHYILILRSDRPLNVNVEYRTRSEEGELATTCGAGGLRKPPKRGQSQNEQQKPGTMV